MTQIKVGLSTVIGDKNFAVLIRAHCPRINIDIRIKFLDRYLIAAAFQQTSSEAAVIPFPSEETTPPVTKIYFVMIVLPFLIKWLFISKNYILSGADTPKIFKACLIVWRVACTSLIRACCTSGSTPRIRH